MKLIIGKKKSGRTTELIKLAAETNSYMVVLNRSEAHKVFGMAKDMGLVILFPLTFDEFIGYDYYAKGTHGFVIDNADLLLHYLVGGAHKIYGITLEKSSDDLANDEAFGIWKDRNVDSVKYQQELRKEWNEEEK